MLFFKVVAYYDEKSEDVKTNGRRRRAGKSERRMQEKIADFNARFNGEAFFTFASCEDEKAVAVVICKNKEYIQNDLNAFLTMNNIHSDEITTDEITWKEMCALISDSSDNGFIPDDDEVCEQFGVEPPRYRMRFDESIISIGSKPQLYSKVKKTLYADTMIPELDRIFRGKKKNTEYFGHPCHYMMLTVDENEVRRETIRTLLSALYVNGRLLSKRYTCIDLDPTSQVTLYDLEHIFHVCSGGCVVIHYDPVGDCDETESASLNRSMVQLICDCINKYRNDTLAVISISHKSTRARNMFYEYLEFVHIVECREELAQGEICLDYLKMLCRDHNIRSDKKLLDMVETGKSYYAAELKSLFDDWYGKKLRTTVFPQYSDVATAATIAVQKKDEGSAYSRLMELIGLEEAKKVICQIKDYYTAQRIFKDRGFSVDHPAMSMVFTGNPGTCKTTVARLVAEIFRDCGILANGKLIECGRGDLVGRYVGWTAPTIQKKFKEADGSVLFIDEAYSLIDDRNGSYGDEAINTLVQEMENHRDNVLVIFAGYPREMENFLDRNPGLRSRIAFHVHFDDYSADELCRIAAMIAKQKGLSIAEDAEEKLHCVFERLRKQPDFGNGRAARTIIETARMRMATRLLKGDISNLTEKQVTTIVQEDIDEQFCRRDQERLQQRRVIGF